MTRSFVRVRNWDKFQQYKDREPRWIKLYRSLNRNYEWCQLGEVARCHLVGIWLLAAELGNEIPNDPEWIKQQINAKSKVKLDELVTYNFLEVYGDVQECTNSYLEKSRVEESRVEGEGACDPAPSPPKTERTPPRKSPRFTPPTVEEVAAYVSEKNYHFDPETFHAYHGTRGWKLKGGVSMKSWKLACVTFEKNHSKYDIGPTNPADTHGKHDLTDNPWHPDDVAEYGSDSPHALWDAYMDEQQDADRGAVVAGTPRGQWPRFADWLRDREEHAA